MKREKPDGKRREFLKAAAAAAGGFALAGCGHKEDPYNLTRPRVPGQAAFATFQEKWVTSACGQCWAGCSVKVRVVEGRAVKIEGHPTCPINKGTLGPKGQAALQMLYHPDRIKWPIRRDGPRGSGKWKQATWDEAMTEIGGALQKMRAEGEARGLIVVDGEPRGMTRELWDRFLQAYGSPNHVDHRSATDGGKVLAMSFMHGVPELPAYDWESTRYVLGFGASLFESWCQSIHLVRASSYLRRDMPGKRVKFVQLSPRYSVTASKADEWLAIEPATYGAFALGIAHVLVRDGHFDEAFVRDHTTGFEDWKDAEGKAHRGFRDLVSKDFPPEKVAKITGISAKNIERIATELWDHRPAVALADGGAASATNGLGTAMSIHALNALLGNLERPGGMIVQRHPPYAPWAAIEPDEAAKKGLAAERLDGAGTARLPLARGCVQSVPEAVLSGTPYPARALFLTHSNPVYSKPAGRRWVDTLRKVPLVVSFSPLPDESTLWADWVLPDHTYLERWEVVDPVPNVGYAIATLRQPAVDPLYDTRATGDVILQLAKAIGAPVADAFPWETSRKAMEERLKPLLNVEGSSTVAGKLTELRKGMDKDGGWWMTKIEFEKWDEAFRTSSGKFEFYSTEIAKRLAAVPDLEQRLRDLGVATRGDDLCLPHWEPPVFAGRREDFPYFVAAYRGIDYAEGGVRHLPWLRELPIARRMAWVERIELHPDDAKKLEVKQGSRVKVETPAGSKRMVVVINGGTRPGTIGLPLGHGPWPPRVEDSEIGGGTTLLANAGDPLAGIFALQGTRARITRDES